MGVLSEHVEGWSPGPASVSDRLDPQPAARIADLLGLPSPDAGGRLPPLWEWAYFADWPAKDELSDDGHPHLGTFQPPLPNRRRMWAGGRVDYAGALAIGTPTTRTGTLLRSEEKHGRSGDMLLVSVGYDYAQNGQVLVREQQNHVYRIGEADAPRPVWGDRPSGPPRSTATWQHRIHTDPIDLFRFSAITGNSHRIHYDQPYVTEVEGFPDLVVHGPLLGMHLGALALRNAPELELRSFELRLLRPVFVGEPAAAVGEPKPQDGSVSAELQILSDPDVVHATATATYTEATDTERTPSAP